ncbi:MAG: hypothetical protein IKX23_06845 [Treponema sp.]|nr:hypothetical protein [Treponema sp.]
MKRFLIFVCFLILSTAFLPAQNKARDPYGAELTKEFAFSLFSQGFFDESEGELKRYLFMTKQSDSECLEKLLYIYDVKNNIGGVNWIIENYYTGENTELNYKIKAVQGKMIFSQRDSEAFAGYKQSLAGVNFSNPVFLPVVDISGMLLNRDFEGVKKAVLNIYTAGYSDFKKLNELCFSYKYKSPGVALLLSAVVPGAGRLYTGSFWGGFSDFTKVGSFVFATVYTGIKNEWKSWEPYVFGTCGLFFYIVELYGAYQSALRFNEAEYNQMCAEMDKIYELLY